VEAFTVKFGRFGVTGALVMSLALGQASFAASAPAGALQDRADARVAPLEDCSAAFVEADKRLGPQELPVEGRLGKMTRGYRRLAGLTAEQFLARYWDPKANSGAGGWIYPPDNGFLIGANGKPTEAVESLPIGKRLDRFGSEYGAFLAPPGAPYGQRSLPPQSLDNADPAYTCNYHEYKVVKTFRVEAGPIAPAFGQPGLGRQFQLDATLLPDAATANVMWLINNGYLQRVN
jgi:hypothetical protein